MQVWSGGLPRIYRSYREAPAPGERNYHAASHPSVRGRALDRHLEFPNSALPPFDPGCLPLTHYSNGAYGFRGRIPRRNRRRFVVHVTGFSRPYLQLTIYVPRTPVAAKVQRYPSGYGWHKRQLPQHGKAGPGHADLHVCECDEEPAARTQAAGSAASPAIKPCAVPGWRKQTRSRILGEFRAETGTETAPRTTNSADFRSSKSASGA